LPKLLCISFVVFILACKPNNTEVKSIAITASPAVDKKMSLTIPSRQDSIDLNYIMGKYDPTKDTAFIEIPVTYADRKGMYLRKETYSDFLKMYEAAKAKGIHLQIRSATRNFDYQKGIWERKWTGETILSTGENASTAFPDYKLRAEKILNYSSMPGTSRHHWGTDLDLNNFNNAWFESGEGLKLFQWLEAHAHEYGFCRPYNKKDSNRPQGYNEEKWHWSYTPLSRQLTTTAEKFLRDSMIVGFRGSEVAAELEVVKNYVLGINKGCLH